MPVFLQNLITRQVLFDQDIEITPGTSSLLTIGPVNFPLDDGQSKDKLSFSGNGTSSFKPRASLQRVTTASSTILEDTTIVAVDYDGAVTLTLPETSTRPNIYVVDEGGFCSVTNTITLVSSNATINGNTVLNQAYSALSIIPTQSNNGWIGL